MKIKRIQLFGIRSRIIYQKKTKVLKFIFFLIITENRYLVEEVMILDDENRKNLLEDLKNLSIRDEKSTEEDLRLSSFVIIKKIF